MSLATCVQTNEGLIYNVLLVLYTNLSRFTEKLLGKEILLAVTITVHV